jgi:hypothetical protein
MRVLMLILMATVSYGQEPVGDIMARVAANQERAQAARQAMVFEQNVLIRLHRGNGRLAREEEYHFTVTPTPDGIVKQRTAFAGKYGKGKELIAYDTPGFEYKGVDIDGELAKELVEEFTNDKSRDGVSHDLFPLRQSEMAKYSFTLKGRQNYRGHDVYVIAFRPSPHRPAGEGEDSIWAGEALIDTQAKQPVLITTWMARGIPLVVKTLLGTDLKHMGFKIAYEKFDDDVWMPVTYGGELHVRAVFVYTRNISISLRNSGFRRAQVDSSVSYRLDEAR